MRGDTLDQRGRLTWLLTEVPGSSTVQCLFMPTLYDFVLSLPSMRPLCALYAPSMRPLCALYAPSMRPLCALYAP